MPGHLVVLSGGLDSTVCLACAADEGHPSEPLVTLSFDYGQRHRVELQRAERIAQSYGTDHLLVRLDASQWGGSALTDPSIAIPEPGAGDLTGSSIGAVSAIPPTYVPARNLIFLSVAVGIAEARAVDNVWVGVNAVDYSGYPDCRPEFVASFASTARLALKRGVEGDPIAVRTPLIELTKADIIRLGLDLDAPLDLTWSCYRGGREPCHECDSCAVRAKGFADAGIRDPAIRC